MRKIIFFVFFVLCYHFNALGQEADQEAHQEDKQQDKLAALLDEREQLSLEYQFLNIQNSNFWGKKSKKDLVQIIQTLKNIINKDSEIIREINTMNLKTRAQTNVETGKIKRQVVDDQRVTMENLHQLKQDLASSQNLHKVKDRELARLREELQEDRRSRQKTDITIAAAGTICLLLLLYIFMLRSKMPAHKTTARKKRP
jgi:CRISPR/Cas system-associated endoribonuclease Cas2